MNLYITFYTYIGTSISQLRLSTSISLCSSQKHYNTKRVDFGKLFSLYPHSLISLSYKLEIFLWDRADGLLGDMSSALPMDLSMLPIEKRY